MNVFIHPQQKHTTQSSDVCLEERPVCCKSFFFISAKHKYTVDVVGFHYKRCLSTFMKGFQNQKSIEEAWSTNTWTIIINMNNVESKWMTIRWNNLQLTWKQENSSWQTERFAVNCHASVHACDVMPASHTFVCRMFLTIWCFRLVIFA